MLWTVHHAFAEPGARGEAYRTFAALGEDTVAALWLVYGAKCWARRRRGRRCSPPSPPPRRGADARVVAPEATAARWGARPCARTRWRRALRSRGSTRRCSRRSPSTTPDVSSAARRRARRPSAGAAAWNAYGMTSGADSSADGGETKGAFGRDELERRERSAVRERPCQDAPVTCLPTVALLCNHSVWPHAVRRRRARRPACTCRWRARRGGKRRSS